MQKRRKQESVARPGSSVIRKPKRLIHTIERKPQEKTSASILVFNGIRISKRFRGITRAWKKQTSNGWILETRGRLQMAIFASETALDEWWIAFQAAMGRVPEAIRIRERSLKPNGGKAAKSRSPGATRVSVPRSKKQVRHGTNPMGPHRPRVVAFPQIVVQRRRGRRGRTAIDREGHLPSQESTFSKPQSSRYDMPEYDCEHFGRM